VAHRSVPPCSSSSQDRKARIVSGVDSKIHAGAAASPFPWKNGEDRIRARIPGMLSVVAA
jgi:hypothetical protein